MTAASETQGDGRHLLPLGDRTSAIVYVVAIDDKAGFALYAEGPYVTGGLDWWCKSEDLVVEFQLGNDVKRLETQADDILHFEPVADDGRKQKCIVKHQESAKEPHFAVVTDHGRHDPKIRITPL